MGILTGGQIVTDPPAGDMRKTVYDSDEDGVISLAQLDSQVSTITEGHIVILSLAEAQTI